MIVEQADIRSFKSLSLLAHARDAGGGSAAATGTALNTEARTMKRRARNDPPSKYAARHPIPICKDAPRWRCGRPTTRRQGASQDLSIALSATSSAPLM